MHYQLGKAGTFDAAHRLQHHQGKCSNLHGHTWRVSVDIRAVLPMADVDQNNGIIVDYGDLKRIWERWDHITILQEDDPLAKLLPLEGVKVESFVWEPTAETLASLILEGVFDLIWSNGWTEQFLVSVTVNESDSSYAQVEATRKRNDE